MTFNVEPVNTETSENVCFSNEYLGSFECCSNKAVITVNKNKTTRNY